jgi:hypothetical protein
MREIKVAIYVKQCPAPLIIDVPTRQEFDQIVEAWAKAKESGQHHVLRGVCHLQGHLWQWHVHTEDVVLVHTMVAPEAVQVPQTHIPPGSFPPFWGGSGHRN